MITPEPEKRLQPEDSDLNLLVPDTDDSVLVIADGPGNTTPGPMHPNTPLGWFPRPVFKRPERAEQEPPEDQGPTKK